MLDLLWVVVIILVILWLLGYFAFNVGPLIFILLVVAVIVLLARLVAYRR